MCGPDSVTHAGSSLCTAPLFLNSPTGLYESQTQVAQLIKEVDQNANGRIEFNEFVDIVAHVRSGKSSGFAKVCD